MFVVCFYLIFVPLCEFSTLVCCVFVFFPHTLSCTSLWYLVVLFDHDIHNTHMRTLTFETRTWITPFAWPLLVCVSLSLFPSYAHMHTHTHACARAHTHTANNKRPSVFPRNHPFLRLYWKGRQGGEVNGNLRRGWNCRWTMSDSLRGWPKMVNQKKQSLTTSWDRRNRILRWCVLEMFAECVWCCVLLLLSRKITTNTKWKAVRVSMSEHTYCTREQQQNTTPETFCNISKNVYMYIQEFLQYIYMYSHFETRRAFLLIQNAWKRAFLLIQNAKHFH